ncbi:30S ribosomal protein S8 [Paenibacillus xylanexedens]|uniref:30S ribosomal protein S8 n=1 Tax=Paenibacillus xylanexedens TaxID=528191 RepID=UPI0034D98372
MIPLFLKYPQNNHPLITPLKTITKPPLPLYTKTNQLPPLLPPLPIPIISTSKPIITHKQPPQSKSPGEVVCYLC